MKKLVGGNWKMICKKETFESFRDIELNKESIVDVFIAIPYVYINEFKNCFSSRNVMVGAQDVSKFEDGAYTGEVSAQMLFECGFKYVVIGHSERRINFNEKSEEINLKLKNALKYSLNPVLCLGESIETRKNGKYIEFIQKQFIESTKDITNTHIDIAYEPVWAIGTGMTAKTEQIKEIVLKIKEEMSKKLIKGRVIYGGSVNEGNSAEILTIDELDGFLVGNASLEKSFQKIIDIASKKTFNLNCHQ